MKNIKKIASFLLALTLILTMVPAAFAETGKITINNVVADDDGNALATYTVYKMLDLVSYEPGTPAVGDTPATPGKYSYKIEDDKWTAFIKDGDGSAYMVINNNGYVEWRAGVSTSTETAGDFAQLALAYAIANDIEPVATSDDLTVTNGELVFSGLDLGYYLLDSSIGILCGLTTTNPNATITTKNKAPTLDKQVKESEGYTSSNEASIGDTVEFRVTINVHKGSENFVIHDEMSEGLTFDPTSVVVTHKIKSSGALHEAAEGTDYTIVTDPVDDDCTFEIIFSDDFMALTHLNSGDEIYVYYSATLNENALVKGDGNNPNISWLEYGDEHTTTPVQTITETYAFDIAKTDGEGDLLDGAKFKLYEKVTVQNPGEEATDVYMEVPLMKVEDSTHDFNVYRRIEGELDSVKTDIETTGGLVRIEGLGTGTYYLEETLAPTGYNKLAEYTKVEIDDDNELVVYTVDAETGAFTYANGGINVINRAGNILPETGGIGTTLFYVVGGVLVAAAVVLLVTKKRMREE